MPDTNIVPDVGGGTGDAPVTLTPEVKAQVDKMCSLVDTAQAELKAGKKANDETVNRIAAESAKLGEDIQKAVARLETETKERKELEAQIARMKSVGAVGKDGDMQLSDPEYMKVFFTALRRGEKSVDGELEKKDFASLVKYHTPSISDDGIKALSRGSDSQMGFYAPADVVRGITKRAFETTPVEQNATVINTAYKSVPWVLDDGRVLTKKRRELAPVAETDAPQMATLEIFSHGSEAEIPISLELLEDGTINFASLITGKAAEAFSLDKNYEFSNGTEGDEAQGFTTLDAWANPEIYERGKFGATVTESAGVFDINDFANSMGGLVERYQANAKWWMHRLSWVEVIKLKDDYGRPLINPQLFFQGVTPQIMGRPVVFGGDLVKPDLTTREYATGQKPIFYGDMRATYLVVNRIGIQAKRDDITDKSVVKFWFRSRFGGAVVNTQSMKMIVVQ